MRFNNICGGNLNIDVRSVRLVMTNQDIGDILGLTEKKVRRLVNSGHLVFAGNAVTDFKMLYAERVKYIRSLQAKL